MAVDSTQAELRSITRRPRWVLPLLSTIVASALVASLWMARQQPGLSRGWAGAPPEVRAVLWPEPRAVGNFSLTTQHGTTFGPQELRGRWSFMFFGYLQCPDVCPMTLWVLRDLRQAMLALDPEARRHQFIFVSLDPEYDSPEAIGSYLEFFDADFIGLSGSVEAIAGLSEALAVMRIEQVDDSGTRLISHTSSVMVFAPDGRAVGALSPPHHPETMLARFAQLRRYLGG